MNQTVKFKNSGFCQFLDEIGEDFEYIDEVKLEEKQRSKLKKHFLTVFVILIAYLAKEVLYLGCALCFMLEILREAAQKSVMTYIVCRIKSIKSVYLFFYSKKLFYCQHQ